MPSNASPREALNENIHKYSYNIYSATLSARPSIQMEDENRQIGSLQLACTVRKADNNNLTCCLLLPVLQGALVT